MDASKPQDDIAIILDRAIPTEPMGYGFVTPEDIADSVDLGIAYKPVLMPRTIYPSPSVSKLENGKFAIYDVGWCPFEDSKHRWNVEAKALKVHRARFLLQRDLIYQDLVLGVGVKEGAPHFFRHWTGGPLMRIMPWTFRRDIVPQYFPDGVFIPDRDSNPLGKHIAKHYVCADGTIVVS